ncbi:MAG: FAD-binding protein [Coriobacteriales bacterium]|jgi:electron transfer flavoprotein alpha subunit|nr:FAD-binding protein [Coriobacteriales bacterium]
MNNCKNIWVMSEAAKDYPALCTLARTLCTTEDAKVNALWIGSTNDQAALETAGADRLADIERSEEELFENYSGCAIGTICGDSPDAVLLATSKRMRLLAAQLAAALETRVINDATALVQEEQGLLAEHMVYGGSALRRERVSRAPAVVLVSDSLLLALATDDRATATTTVSERIVSPEGSSGITLQSRKARTVEAVNLASVPCVISVGRGFEKQEDLQLAQQLADCLQAEIGCTRPIAEGMGWMSHERYIGVSGAMLKPELFIAVGLSGQIQHMVGANRARTIIALNNDKNAPIFRQADYGIVGDLYAVLPRLSEALR